MATLWVMAMLCMLSASHAMRPEEEAAQIDNLKLLIGNLAAQTMALQENMEETIRSSGKSGIKKTRLYQEGTKAYHTPTHTNHNSVAAIHDHANNRQVVGIGEFSAVLNGVEFRTRHNDYHLVMPTVINKVYHKTDPITCPDIPPAVTEKETVEEQIAEMRKWFKAWVDQDYSERDYRGHFKPILCYLEGAYTYSGDEVDESFESDRHHLEAKTWFELQDKVRFMSNNGRKSTGENVAYLPTTILTIVNETYPIYAQWNYRVLCHPLERDLPLNRFRLVDDVSYRMAKNVLFKDVEKSRAARYTLNPVDSDEWEDGPHQRAFIDDLMAEIPGKDNYKGNVVDDSSEDEDVLDWNTGEVMNAGYYHRWFRSETKDASGRTERHRGFSDDQVFYALNTRDKIAPISYTKDGVTYSQKMSFAIPLEVIYLTPLYEWNPFDIPYKGSASSTDGKTVSQGGRNGGLTPDKAYNGTNNRIFYRSPEDFYTGNTGDGDPADTSKGTVGVLDAEGIMHKAVASGTYIHLPEIEGVGYARTRYPIMPIHGEGDTVWQELEVLKDIVLGGARFNKMKRERNL